MNLAPKNIIICNNSKGNYSMLVVFVSRAGLGLDLTRPKARLVVT